MALPLVPCCPYATRVQPWAVCPTYSRVPHSLHCAEGKEVAALLEDLGEKVAELRELAAQDADTKSMIKARASPGAVGAPAVQ